MNIYHRFKKKKIRPHLMILSSFPPSSPSAALASNIVTEPFPLSRTLFGRTGGPLLLGKFIWRKVKKKKNVQSSLHASTLLGTKISDLLLSSCKVTL